MTLRLRIALVAALAVAAVVLISASVVCVAVRSSLRGEIDDTLAARARALTDVDAPFAMGGAWMPGWRTARADPLSESPASHVQFVMGDGTVVGKMSDTRTLPASRRALALARDGGRPFYSDLKAGRSHLRVLTVPGRFGGAVQVARSLSEVDRELKHIVALMVVIATAGVVLGGGLAAIVARAALAPISAFTRRTEALTGDPDLSQRIEAHGRNELSRLAASFNTTLDALERSVEAQRQLVADASHELRTPVASLRANVELLAEADRLPPAERAALRADIVFELDELTALVADLMELARGVRRHEFLDDVRLDAVVESVVARAQRRSGDGVRFRTQLEPTVVIGDAERIHRAVTNMVDNAFKWSGARGVVEVAVAEGRVSVRDHGPGFTPEDLPHIFERFYRARGARGMPGSGLGLAIVRHTAEAHGGRVQAANAPGGGGLVCAEFGPPLAVAEGDRSTLATS